MEGGCGVPAEAAWGPTHRGGPGATAQTYSDSGRCALAGLAASVVTLALLASARPDTVAVAVTWEARDSLPQGSTVEVQLQELGPADAPARVVATATLPGAGLRPPVPFRIAYDAKGVDPRREYTVRARVLDAGRRLLYLSERRVPVLTRGAGTEATVEVEPVRSGRSR